MEHLDREVLWLIDHTASVDVWRRLQSPANEQSHMAAVRAFDPESVLCLTGIAAMREMNGTRAASIFDVAEFIGETKKKTGPALAELAKSGWLIRTQGSRGRAFYSINPAHFLSVSRIRTLLSELERMMGVESQTGHEA